MRWFINAPILDLALLNILGDWNHAMFLHKHSSSFIIIILVHTTNPTTIETMAQYANPKHFLDLKAQNCG